MDIEQLRGIHEIVFESKDPHVLVYLNTQTDNYENHWHTPLEILMPVENNYTAYVNGKKYVLNPYDILIITPNVYHAYEAPDTGSRYFVIIDVSVLKDILGISQVLSQLNPSGYFTPETAPEIHGRLKQLVLGIAGAYFNGVPTQFHPETRSAMNDPLSSAAVAGTAVPEIVIYTKLLEIFSLTAEFYGNNEDAPASGHQENQDFVNKFTFICNYIDGHCTEQLSLEQMAKMANFSKYHFSRLFKEFTNESFYRYVNIKRIRYAEQLLLYHNTSVTDIALSCGYSNTSSFIRMFKQINGCTPRDFREQRKSLS